MTLIASNQSININLNQEKPYDSHTKPLKNENKSAFIAKVSLGVFSGLAVLALGYQAAKSYNYITDKPDEINLNINTETFSKMLKEYVDSANQLFRSYGIDQERLPEVLADNIIGKRNPAVNFIETCMNDNSQNCMNVVKNAHLELSKIDPIVEKAFAELCRTKTGQACQEIVNQAFPNAI